MPLKAMILDTPLEKPARSVIRGVRWLKQKLRRVAPWFNPMSERVRILLSANKNRNVGDIDVVICSPGGVATTMLLQHIGCFVHTNDIHDRDTLKHVPDPDFLLSDSNFQGRILYIYGDIDSVIASLERRGWVRIAGAKLGSFAAVFLPYRASRIALARAVAAQIETFQTCGDPRLKTLHFENIWENTEKLAEFLCIDDPKFLESFPQRKRRQTERPE